MGFKAVILAGSRAEEAGNPALGGAPHKALIVLEGQTLLERVAGALTEAGADEIHVCCDPGPVADSAEALGLPIVAAQSGPSASVSAAIEQLGTPLLITTADHAFLKGDWVRQLVSETKEPSDLSLMLAREERVEAAMPGVKRTYLKFADGRWSGCNLFYFYSDHSPRILDLWRQIEVDRKRPWRIARRIGLRVLLSYALGRLTIREGLARLGREIGITPFLVEAEDGLAAVDIDKPQDLEDAKAYLARKTGG